ncbi:MAG: flagellin lysine-N-methylase [Myxococcales bacterium]|nr:flagellin lysine-N-methylase [Myxococcales bacterium]
MSDSRDDDPNRPDRHEWSSRIGFLNDDMTFRYMERFQCVGPECMDTCCYGWQVVIDNAHYQQLKLLAYRDSKEERERFNRTFTRSGKGRRAKWLIKFKGTRGTCAMLDDGMCHVHAKWGESALPHICAIYPRYFRRMGQRLELTGTVSCPEVAKQLLLREDALEPVPLERDKISRLFIVGGYDTRDVRPYWRLLQEMRAFVVWLLQRPGYSLDTKLFFVSYFTHRTRSCFNKEASQEAADEVWREVAALEREETLAEIARRMERLETKSDVVMRLTQDLLRYLSPKGKDDVFRELVEKVLATYRVTLGSLLRQSVGPEGLNPMQAHFQEYQDRKLRVRQQASERIEQYMTHFAIHHWMHRLPTQSPDLFVHQLRLLILMMVQKFLLYSHPDVLNGLEALKRPASPPQSDDAGVQTEAESDRGDEPDDDQTPLGAGEFLRRAEVIGTGINPEPFGSSGFIECLDRAAVEIYYRVGRFVEHNTVMNELERALERDEMGNIGGALHLIRF